MYPYICPFGSVYTTAHVHSGLLPAWRSIRRVAGFAIGELGTAPGLSLGTRRKAGCGGCAVGMAHIPGPALLLIAPHKGRARAFGQCVFIMPGFTVFSHCRAPWPQRR